MGLKDFIASFTEDDVEDTSERSSSEEGLDGNHSDSFADSVNFENEQLDEPAKPEQEKQDNVKETSSEEDGDKRVEEVEDVDESLRDLADEAVTMGLREEKIYELFTEHGVPEPRTRGILKEIGYLDESNNLVRRPDADMETTLRQVVKESIEKGRDEDEIIESLAEHGIEEEQAHTVVEKISEALDEDNVKEAMDAISLQKEVGLSEGEDAFMPELDKDQENLQVGRIYLTGRKPSHEKMKVKGLGDIASDDEEREELDPDENMEKHVEDRKAEKEHIENTVSSG